MKQKETMTIEQAMIISADENADLELRNEAWTLLKIHYGDVHTEAIEKFSNKLEELEQAKLDLKETIDLNKDYAVSQALLKAKDLIGTSYVKSKDMINGKYVYSVTFDTTPAMRFLKEVESLLEENIAL